MITFTILDKLNRKLYWAYRGQVPENGNRQCVLDNRFSVWYIEKGNVRIDGEKFSPIEVKKGFWVFNPVVSRRSQFFAPESKITSISFDLSWPNHEPIFALNKPLILPSDQCRSLRQKAELLLKTGGKHVDLHFRRTRTEQLKITTFLDINEKFNSFLSEFAHVLTNANIPVSPFPYEDNRIRCIAEILDTMPFCGSIPYRYIQEKVCLSRVQIDRIFIAATGQSLKAHVEKNIRKKAEDLLICSNKTIKEIAALLGFTSPSHFCAWFRRVAGMYPDAFRKT